MEKITVQLALDTTEFDRELARVRESLQGLQPSEQGRVCTVQRLKGIDGITDELRFYDGKVNIESVVLANEHLVLEGASGCPETFWISLAPNVGWARFALKEGTRETFQAVEVRPAHEPTPSPLVSMRGVWWTRQAAFSAQQAIDSYRQGLDSIGKF